MIPVNKVLYESKLIGYPKPFKNKVRTFCQNPGGFVSQENYDNNLAVVNGHSYKDYKSGNTNLAILCSHNFNEPFNQPIAYAQKVGELTNMLVRVISSSSDSATYSTESAPGRASCRARTSSRRCPTRSPATSRPQCLIARWSI